MSTVPEWLSKWSIQAGGTWAAHIAHGSKGGVDYAAPLGTDMLAASDGHLTFRYLSDGSSVLRVERPDGTATELLHGHPIGPVPRDVSALEHIGESGGEPGTDGANGSTGPHIHAHDTDASGKRVLPWSTIKESEITVSYSIVPDAKTGSKWVVSLVTGKRAAIASDYDEGLLKRVKANNGADNMLAAEIDIVEKYLAKINPPSAAGPDPAIDYAAIAKATVDEQYRRLEK